jgi:hypothetical protein
MAADGLFDFEGEQLTVLELAKRVLPGGVPAVPVVARPVADQAPTPRRVGRPRKNSASIQVAKQETGGRLLRLWDQAIALGPARCISKKFKPSTNKHCRYCHNYACDLRGSRIKA